MLLANRTVAESVACPGKGKKSKTLPYRCLLYTSIPFLAEGKTWTVFNYDARYEGALVVKD